MKCIKRKTVACGCALMLSVAFSGCQMPADRGVATRGGAWGQAGGKSTTGTSLAGLKVVRDEVAVEQVMKLMRLVRELAYENARLEWAIANGGEPIESGGGEGVADERVGLDELIEKADEVVHARIDAMFFSLEQELYQRQERLREQVDKKADKKVNRKVGNNKAGDQAEGELGPGTDRTLAP